MWLILGGLATVILASLAWSCRWLAWRLSNQRCATPPIPPVQNIKQFAELAGIVTALALRIELNCTIGRMIIRSQLTDRRIFYPKAEEHAAS